MARWLLNIIFHSGSSSNAEIRARDFTPLYHTRGSIRAAGRRTQEAAHARASMYIVLLCTLALVLCSSTFRTSSKGTPVRLAILRKNGVGAEFSVNATLRKKKMSRGFRFSITDWLILIDVFLDNGRGTFNKKNYFEQPSSLTPNCNTDQFTPNRFVKSVIVKP